VGDLDADFRSAYDELRGLAQHFLQGERPGHTLAATGLVHEAYLRLMGSGDATTEGRSRFFSSAARAMRHILIEHARRRLAAKRGAGGHRTTLDEAHAIEERNAEELLTLNEALERLGEMNPRLRSIVEYRFFCGLEQADIARLLGVSERTIERDWLKARVWLYTEMSPSIGAGA
jgi:RNA polymerase sigma factor (TIGR02999 family)